jgi:hypothetical protein
MMTTACVCVCELAFICVDLVNFEIENQIKIDHRPKNLSDPIY